MFRYLFPVLFFQVSFLGGLFSGIGSAVGGLLGFAGQKDTNATNAGLSRENMQWMSEENVKQRDFNANQAYRDRTFQSHEAGKSRDFSSIEAAKARNYNTEMSNTQYQRAVKDMMDAGLNPMLLAGKAGGNSAAPAPMPSSAAASGSRASASGTGAPNLARMENAASSAAGIATSIAHIGRALAETEQVKAQTDVTRAQALNVAEDTKLKASQGHESFWRSIKTQAEETKTYKEIEKLQADIIHSTSSAQKLNSITRLIDLAIPKAVNEAMAEDTWFKRNVSPFLRDASQTGNLLNHLPIFRMLKK